MTKVFESFPACRSARPTDVAQIMGLAIQALHIGMKVRHPNYGVGAVKSLTEHTAEIVFDDSQRTIAPESSDLTLAGPGAQLTELQLPLDALIRQTAQAVVDALGLEKSDTIVEGLGDRWQNGTLLLQPADTSLQPKEVPLETFFHKIVMIRNNLRVLEQKVNANAKLTDAEKFDMQQPAATARSRRSTCSSRRKKISSRLNRVEGAAPSAP